MCDTRSRGWCYTINNYNDEDPKTVYLELTKQIKYFVEGKEVGANGTPHKQGFIYFINAKTMSAVKKIKYFQRAHLEAMKGTPTQAADYCKKDGDFQEFGEVPAHKSVNSWFEIKHRCQEGITWNALLEEFPEEAIRYSSGMRQYWETFRPKHEYTLPEPRRPFQQFILDYIQQPIHDRQIMWIYDEVGNAGKSALADHLMSNNNFKVFTNGKTADIAHAWNGENVIFDYSRSQAEQINYQIIEDLKNGRVFSGKYQSQTKFYKRPHVICFANFKPDRSKMSADRLVVLEMRPDYDLELLE